MNELTQLYQEAAETARPPAAHVVTQRVQRRFRRRRAGRFGVGALAAAALVFGGAAWHGGGAPPPKPIDTAAQLPADHAVGRGLYLQPYLGQEGSTSGTALLRTESGSSYAVPDQIGPSSAQRGAPLSPDGRWLVRSVGHQVVVRDLTGRRTYHTRRAGSDGFPVAWSSNGRWLVLHGAPASNQIDNTLLRLDLSNGAVRRLPVDATRNADRLAAILPDGDPVFEVPGEMPTPKPTKLPAARYGTGVYQVVDARTGALRTSYPAPNAQRWLSEDVAGFDPHTPSTHQPRSVWVPQVGSPLVVSPDGRQAAAVIGRYDERRLLRLDILDLPAGSAQTIDVPVGADGAPADTVAAVREWRPVSLDHGKLTLLGRTRARTYVFRLEIDLAHDNAVAGTKVHYPAGSLPAGVASLY